MSTTAEKAARLFISLAAGGDEPSPITHLQLQKLLYYAQGWCLVRSGRALFGERIEAWEHGPVVADVYAHFKKYEGHEIAAEEGRPNDAFDREDRDAIERVWREYGRFSALGLRDMTHKESPWKDARKGLPDGVPSRELITEESLLVFFKKEQEKRLRKLGIDPADLEAAVKEAREGKTIPWDTMKRELRASAPVPMKAGGEAGAPEVPVSKRAAG